MAEPVTVDIPHKLGREGARARISGGVGKIADLIPGGALTDNRWEGDTLFFTIEGMGQRVASRLDVADDVVKATVDLPPFLAMFANRIREKLADKGTKLLK